MNLHLKISDMLQPHEAFLNVMAFGENVVNIRVFPTLVLDIAELDYLD